MNDIKTNRKPRCKGQNTTFLSLLTMRIIQMTILSTIFTLSSNVIRSSSAFTFTSVLSPRPSRAQPSSPSNHQISLLVYDHHRRSKSSLSLLTTRLLNDSRPFLQQHPSSSLKSPSLQDFFVLRAVYDGINDSSDEGDESEDDNVDADEQQADVPTTKGTNIFAKARAKFMARPGTYLFIPIIAALVGWFTNYLAVQMIFYPINYWGLPIYRRPEVPLGLLGWQGIVPCKTVTMSVALVEMVTSQLLTVQQAFSRLDPSTMAKLLAPQIPSLGQDVLSDLNVVTGMPVTVWNFITKHTSTVFNVVNVRFLTGLVRDMVNQCDSIFSLRDCVVDQMVLDRAKLGQLFQSVGQKELDFLTNSGLWFGFLLGLIQMAVALVWDNPWSLSIGGMIVGLATNWLALKWIFEPIYPTQLGIGPLKLPFVIQGMFLRRQKEVAAEFSKFFAENVVNSANIWQSMLTDPKTTPNIVSIISSHVGGLLNVMSLGMFGRLSSSDSLLCKVSQSIVHRLQDHVHVLHAYVDKALGLEATLRVQMEAMSPAKFERVLHPIFEQDELTLIVAGGALGLAAGLIQQGLETGAISIPWNKLQRFNPFPSMYRFCRSCAIYLTAKVKRSDTDSA